MKLIFDGGAVMFPIAYIIGDVLTEVYGYKFARRTIWVGFIMMILSSIIFTIVRMLPPDASYQHQKSFEELFSGMFLELSPQAFLRTCVANS